MTLCICSAVIYLAFYLFLHLFFGFTWIYHVHTSIVGRNQQIELVFFGILAGIGIWGICYKNLMQGRKKKIQNRRKRLALLLMLNITAS